MSYWWERYSKTPASNTSSPPDGAPEDHFPDQVNNIQRQNMAAVAEIGEKVLANAKQQVKDPSLHEWHRLLHRDWA